MNTFRFFWTAHKWVGISAATFLLLLSITGFLLLLKKDFAWIQPPTQQGAAGKVADFLPLDAAWQRVLAEKHPAFVTEDDLDRVDVRPGKRIYKFRSKRDHAEIQVDAVTGAVLSTATRESDFIESLHDGSWIGEPVHAYVMPLVAICVVFLVFSGLWLWLEPHVKRYRRKRRDAKRAAA